MKQDSNMCKTDTQRSSTNRRTEIPEPVTDPKDLCWRPREGVDVQIFVGVTVTQSGHRNSSSRGEDEKRCRLWNQNIKQIDT